MRGGDGKLLIAAHWDRTGPKRGKLPREIIMTLKIGFDVLGIRSLLLSILNSNLFFNI